MSLLRRAKRFLMPAVLGAAGTLGCVDGPPPLEPMGPIPVEGQPPTMQETFDLRYNFSLIIKAVSPEIHELFSNIEWIKTLFMSRLENLLAEEEHTEENKIEHIKETDESLEKVLQCLKTSQNKNHNARERCEKRNGIKIVIKTIKHTPVPGKGLKTSGITVEVHELHANNYTKAATGFSVFNQTTLYPGGISSPMLSIKKEGIEIFHATDPSTELAWLTGADINNAHADLWGSTNQQLLQSNHIDFFREGTTELTPDKKYRAGSPYRYKEGFTVKQISPNPYRLYQDSMEVTSGTLSHTQDGKLGKRLPGGNWEAIFDPAEEKLTLTYKPGIETNQPSRQNFELEQDDGQIIELDGVILPQQLAATEYIVRTKARKIASLILEIGNTLTSGGEETPEGQLDLFKHRDTIARYLSQI